MNGYLPFFYIPSSLSFAHQLESDSQLQFFSCRANVVIGDFYAAGAQATAEAINSLPPGRGKSCWKRCDVTNWEEQVALFEYAVKKFGGVDVVVCANSMYTFR